jgi:hypothetical protein
MPTCVECKRYINPTAAAEHKVEHLQEKLSAIYHERTDSMHQFDAITNICMYCGHSKAYVASYHPVCQAKKKKRKKPVKKTAKKTTRKKPQVLIVPDHFDFDREI